MHDLGPVLDRLSFQHDTDVSHNELRILVQSCISVFLL